MHIGDLMLDDRPSTALLIGGAALLTAILVLAFLSVIDVCAFVVTTWCH